MAHLYITEQGAVLKRTGQRLVVEKDDRVLADLPVTKVEGVLIFGNVQFTTQAVRLLIEQGVEMALFTSHGKLLGHLVSPFTRNIDLGLAQYTAYRDPEFVLGLVRSIVAAKVHNGHALLGLFSHNHPETDIRPQMERLAELSRDTESHADLPALLGLEGAAARVYFDALAAMVRHSFQFEGRRRRPAPDPVNALLSLGYSMVYNEIASLLDGMGFDPYLGFYHQPHYGHATLASDLLEEFRAPIVDRFTLGLINNRIFKSDDFSLHGPSGGIRLNDEPRKRYFVEYERFLTRPMAEARGEAEGADAAEGGTNARSLFRSQAEKLRKALANRDEPYSPYRFRW